MEYKVRKVDTEVLLEEYRVLLKTVDNLPLLISGSSMTPFLVHGRDTVYLSGIDRPLKRGDIVLYRRKSGAYVLHRIYSIEGDTFSMVGDAQTVIERGILKEQIFAVVHSARRKGKYQETGCFWWDFFEKIWIRMVPVRPGVMYAYSLLSRLIRRKR